MGLPVSPADGSGADDLGWERWSGPLADKPSALFSSQANVVRAPSALHIEVSLAAVHSCHDVPRRSPTSALSHTPAIVTSQKDGWCSLSVPYDKACS